MNEILRHSHDLFEDFITQAVMSITQLSILSIFGGAVYVLDSDLAARSCQQRQGRTVTGRSLPSGMESQAAAFKQFTGRVTNIKFEKLTGYTAPTETARCQSVLAH